MLNLRGNVPEFIHITDERCYDSNFLDIMIFEPRAIYVMDRAYVDFEALNRIDQAESFFVVRSRVNLRRKVLQLNDIDKANGVLVNQVVRLTGQESRKKYPQELRWIEYQDDQMESRLIFLTNNFDITALEAAYIYRNRWQVELFFKWIKQNLTIRHLWGQSINAVHIHIWVAIITYLLLAYIKWQFKCSLSISEIAQIFTVSTFSKASINELLTKSALEQIFDKEPNLFNINEKLTHQ